MSTSERVCTERHYPILDKERTLTPALFEYYNQVDPFVDIQKFGDGFLVKKEDALGLEIDIELYEKTLKGEFEGSFHYRHLFFERVDDVCFVQKHKLSSKHPDFTMENALIFTII